MKQLSIEFIKNEWAKTPTIFSRGENIFLLGNYTLLESSYVYEKYRYGFDGTYGRYEVLILPDKQNREILKATCTCPYPYDGCKHTVAAFLDLYQRYKRRQKGLPTDLNKNSQGFLTPEEIREMAIASRKQRAKKEKLKLESTELFKGMHTVRGESKNDYIVTIYTDKGEKGHCTCPDFAVNHLETCKHLIFTFNTLKKNRQLVSQGAKEVFPFVHLTYSSRLKKPVCYYERIEDPELQQRMDDLFDDKGMYVKESLHGLYQLYQDHSDNFDNSESTEILRFDSRLLDKMQDMFFEEQSAEIAKNHTVDFSFLKTDLYAYQKDGIRFALYRKAAILADEMGLGKTLQAIAIALLKKDVYGFTKVLIVSPSSLKNQWKMEIEKFTSERALVISGSWKIRRQAYLADSSYFKITNYEAILRDGTTVREWNPDMIILDEAQRIKNFETKTHQAIKQIPHSHSLVLTGTPLENKLEDLYSIVQFSDPELLSPLWAFAANHFSMSREGNNKVQGYHNLEIVHEKIKPLLLRRTKAAVFDSLPAITQNNYYLDLSEEQSQVHLGYMHSLLRIVKKKFQTPMDLKMMQKILLTMRMVCNSTYLIDKSTNISPKLGELASLLKEIVVENNRKVILFTEWTTMSYLVGKVISDLGIDFVEFSGKVPVEKRQLLIDEFRNNSDCMVFIATDAGGVGLNLQNCDCLINIELPWNPAKLNQRIGRIHRIGQKSNKINVINLISRNSIEEKVYAGIGLKQDLFDAVISGAADDVDFGRENRNRFLEQVRSMFDNELEEEDSSSSLETSEFSESVRPSRPVGPELDDQTPHYLNPSVFQETETELDITEEYLPDEPSAAMDVVSPIAASELVDLPAAKPESPREHFAEKDLAESKPEQARTIPPEQLEAVLNQGLAFLNTLTQAATGKPLFNESNGKSVQFDKETGEVVLRFKL